MALLWQHEQDGVCYQVRSAGQTRRLYANNVLHSEYHPRQILTRSVWDLMLISAWFRSPEQVRRILVLGLGGGTLVHQFLQLLSPDCIVAIERDPIHLQVARDYFALDDPRVTLVGADARHWVAEYAASGQPGFDLVIEDLFSVSEDDASRAFPVTQDWFEQLSACVNEQGVLTINFADWKDFSRSGAGKTRLPGWETAFRFATPDCHNAVVSWQRQPVTSQQLRNRLLADTRLDPRSATGVRYSVRKAFS